MKDLLAKLNPKIKLVMLSALALGVIWTIYSILSLGILNTTNIDLSESSMHFREFKKNNLSTTQKEIKKNTTLLKYGKYEITATGAGGEKIIKNIVIKPFLSKTVSDFSSKLFSKAEFVASEIEETPVVDGETVYTLGNLNAIKHDKNSPFGGSDEYFPSPLGIGVSTYPYINSKIFTVTYMDLDDDQTARMVIYDINSRSSTEIPGLSNISSSSYIYSSSSSVSFLVYDQESNTFYYFNDPLGSPVVIKPKDKPSMGVDRPLVDFGSNKITFLSGADYFTVSPNDHSNETLNNYTINVVEVQSSQSKQQSIANIGLVSSIRLSPSAENIAIGTDKTISVLKITDDNPSFLFTATAGDLSDYFWVDDISLLYQDSTTSIQQLYINSAEIISRTLFANNNISISKTIFTSNKLYASVFVNNDPNQSKRLLEITPNTESPQNQPLYFAFLPYETDYYELLATRSQVYIRFKEAAYREDMDLQKLLSEARSYTNDKLKTSNISTDFTFIP